MKITKPKSADLWLSDDTWNSLKLKEKAYVSFVLSRRYTTNQIMLKLYFDDRSAFWRFKKRVNKKLAGDVEKVNRKFDHPGNVAKNN